MKKLILMLLLIPLISACATTEKALDRAGATMCSNADQIRLAAVVTIQNAAFIADPVVRASVVGSAQAMLTALDQCPKGVPTDA